MASLAAQQEGRLPFLSAQSADKLMFRTKTASATKLWLAVLSSERRFSLRDPSAPDNDDRALPCHLPRVARRRCVATAPR